MRVPIRPGKVTCAGLVGIMLVLPNSIWRGPDVKVQPVVKWQKIERHTRLHRTGLKLGGD